MSLEDNQKPQDMVAQAINETYADNEYTDKASALKMLLQYDLVGCDAKWTLFVAAAQSYRYKTELWPFPAQFIMNTEAPMDTNIDGLIATITDTPRLHLLLEMLKDGKEGEINSAVLELIYWVLVTNNLPFLRYMGRDEMCELIKRLDVSVEENQLPTQAFELQNLHGVTSEQEFDQSRQLYATGYGFYGDQLDTFFSLVHNGFQRFRCARNNFTGEVLELTPTLEASVTKSPSSAAWGFSACGSIISCIGICEYAVNPHFIKYKTYEDPEGTITCEKVEISNSDLVRLRYLFFYGNRTTDIMDDELMPKKSWVKRNGNILTVSASVAIIVTTLLVTERGAIVKDFCTSSINKAFKFCRNIVNFNLNSFK